MDTEHVKEFLKSKYIDVVRIDDNVYRAIDRHGDRDYAVRYFDFSGELESIASKLQKYQEDLLSELYFSDELASDIRWNHYLYFITNNENATKENFAKVRDAIESDRNYARKKVVLEKDFEKFLLPRLRKPSRIHPEDLASFWSNKLDEHGLGYIFNDSLSVPTVVGMIRDGIKPDSSSIVSPNSINTAEKAAARHFLKNLCIKGFRPYPLGKTFQFKKVNLIVGPNGTGKTSLLEAIEYLYCGKNRRFGEFEPNTSITGEFFDSTESLTTSASTPLSRLRARNAHWYAKTDLRTVSLASSFGKFNFLDTDAATRLSIDSSRDQLMNDISRLLLGAESERLLDRMMRVKAQVDNGLRERANLLQTKEQLLKAAKNRLALLKNSPKLSDNIFLEAIDLLTLAKVRRLPENKLQLSEIRKDLQTGLMAIGLVKNDNTEVLALSSFELDRFYVKTSEDISTISSLINEANSSEIKSAEIDQKIKQLSRQKKSYDYLNKFSLSGYRQLKDRETSLQKNVFSMTEQLSFFEKESTDILNDIDHDLLLKESIATLKIYASDCRERANQARNSQIAFEKTQSSLTTLKQKLFNIAHELISGGGDQDKCPVCKTIFKKGELLNRLFIDEGEDFQSNIKQLNDQVLHHTNCLHLAESKSTLLSRLYQLIDPTEYPLISIGDALAELEIRRSNFFDFQQELSNVKLSLKNLESLGLTQERLTQSLSIAGLKEFPEANDLALRLDKVISLISSLADDSNLLQKKLELIHQKKLNIISNLNFDNKMSLHEIMRELQLRLKGIEAAKQARATVAEVVNIDEDESLESIRPKLEASQRLILKLMTVNSQELKTDSDLSKEAEDINKITSDVKILNESLKKLKKASQLLDELQLSAGADLAQIIMTQNAEEIDQTFRSILSPCEFELKSDKDKFNIIRQSNDKSIQLEEMSTGQRSAYALSLFLAMNSSISSAPPLLLFDDPIAHIDDINVLSFLDHLRDISLEGSRQIFFATSDTKVSGLFRRKFNFFGKQDFFEVALTRNGC